jgi:hypothetical protein
MIMRKAGIFLTLLAAGVAAGQIAGDPPSRVARLNYLQGQVSFRPGSVDEWTAASLNYPLYDGDHLWTDLDAQTEIHIGSTAVRMGPETALAVLNLDDRMVQLSLTGGTIHVRLRSLGAGESFEIDTPNSAVTLLRPGDYRVQVDENNAQTTVTVHGGDTEVTGGGRAFAVHARETANMTGIDDTFSNVISSERGFDNFDRWCQDRDRREEQSESARYVGREMTGYEDLDQNGTWSEVPEYGRVWTPRVVVAGWAPYRYGRWAWVEPWGWTWVDDAPWGFAPFHYGRWAHYRGGWVWVPGTYVARPVYAPALVAFVGGSHFSLAVGFGGNPGVAWFPLGPREVYRPAYHVSDYYVHQVNVTHVNVTNINVTNVNVTNVRYVNQNVNGAVTAVPQAAFVGARSVRSSAVAVPASAVAQAQVVGTAAPVAPERVSVLGRSEMGGRVSAPPARMMDRTVVVRNAPPPPPVSFGAKRDALMANPGRPIDAGTAETLRRNDRFQRPQMVRSATPQDQTPRRFGRSDTQQAPQQVQQPQQPQVQQQPQRNDRPVFRRQTEQQQAQPPVQQQQQEQVQRPRFERPQVQQPQQTQQAPPAQVQQQQPAVQRPRFERPQPQQQQPQQQQPPQPQAAPPARVEQPRREVQEQRQEHKQEQRKVERKGERKEEKKEDRKQ